jgi:ATP-dependent HslUV protease ATP-binding subunit HslU
VKDEETQAVRARARAAAEERLLDLLLPRPASSAREPGRPIELPSHMPPPEEAGSASREKLRELLRAGKLDDRNVEVEVTEQHNPAVQIFSQAGLEEMGINLRELFGGRGHRTRRKVRVPEAVDLLAQEEAGKLVDMDKVVREAVHRAENSGIVFLDEIDKIAGREGGHGPDVSREGVQRDLLPIVEGSTVTTKYGPVRTDHVLFIAAGAFHVSKPSDLIPELQGRFPIRVELESLGNADFVRILKEPENSLTRQYEALLATEGVRLTFSDEAVGEIARMAALANERMQNIGARRLHTILERLLDELSFEAPELPGRDVTITLEYVRERLVKLLEDEDLSKYIL